MFAGTRDEAFDLSFRWDDEIQPLKDSCSHSSEWLCNSDAGSPFLTKALLEDLRPHVFFLHSPQSQTSFSSSQPLPVPGCVQRSGVDVPLSV